MTTNSNSTMTKTSNAKNSYDTTLFTMNKTKTASVSTMTSINPIANISTSKRTTIDTATQKNSWTTKDSSNESKLENENESSMKKACKRKLPMLNDINQMITCAICSGYFIDATTIVECLDTFCKSCIVQYLETSKSCPICDAPLSKTKPHQSLRQDILKQSLVYKLAPQIFIDEMKRRRRFYERIRPDCEPSSKEDAGLVPAYSYYFRPNDKISMSLEYIDRSQNNSENSNEKANNSRKRINSSKMQENDPNLLMKSISVDEEDMLLIPSEDKPVRRYLLCPAVLTILQLKKFIANKYGEFESFSDFKIEIYYAGQKLKEDFTLMEVAYIYTWGANDPMRFCYCFVRKRSNTQLKAIENSIVEESSSSTPSSSSHSASLSASNSTSKSTNQSKHTKISTFDSSANKNVIARSSFSIDDIDKVKTLDEHKSGMDHQPKISVDNDDQKNKCSTNAISKISVHNKSSSTSSTSSSSTSSSSPNAVIVHREYDNYQSGEIAKKRIKLMDDSVEFSHNGTQTFSLMSTTTTTVRITNTPTTSQAGYNVRTMTTKSFPSSSSVTIDVNRNNKRNDSKSNLIATSGTKNETFANMKTNTIVKLIQRKSTQQQQTDSSKNSSSSSETIVKKSSKPNLDSNHHQQQHHHHHHHHHHHQNGKNSNLDQSSKSSVSNCVKNKSEMLSEDGDSVEKHRMLNKPMISNKNNQPIKSVPVTTSSSNNSSTSPHPLSPPAIRIKLTTSPNSSPSQLIGQIISPKPSDLQTKNSKISVSSQKFKNSSDSISSITPTFTSALISTKTSSVTSTSNTYPSPPQGYKMITSQGVQSESNNPTGNSLANNNVTSTTNLAKQKGKVINDIINRMSSKSNFRSSCLKNSINSNSNATNSSTFEELINVKKHKSDSDNSAIDSLAQPKSSGNLVLRISTKSMESRAVIISPENSDTSGSCSPSTTTNETNKADDSAISTTSDKNAQSPSFSSIDETVPMECESFDADDDNQNKSSHSVLNETDNESGCAIGKNILSDSIVTKSNDSSSLSSIEIMSNGVSSSSIPTNKSNSLDASKSLNSSPLSVTSILSSTSPTVSPKSSKSDESKMKLSQSNQNSIISSSPMRGPFLTPLDLSSKKSPPSVPAKSLSPISSTVLNTSPKPTITAKSNHIEISSTCTATSGEKTKSRNLPANISSLPRPKSLASKIVPPLKSSNLPSLTLSSTKNSSKSVKNKSSVLFGRSINPKSNVATQLETHSSGLSMNANNFLLAGFRKDNPFGAFEALFNNRDLALAALMMNQQQKQQQSQSINQHRQSESFDSKAENSKDRNRSIVSTNSLSSSASNLISSINGSTNETSNNLKRLIEQNSKFFATKHNTMIKNPLISNNITFSHLNKNGNTLSHHPLIHQSFTSTSLSSSPSSASSSSPSSHSRQSSSSSSSSSSFLMNKSSFFQRKQ